MKKVIALFFAAGILFTQPILAQEAAATEQAVATDSNAAPADTTAAAATEESAPAVEAEASFTQILKDKFIEGGPLFMAPVLLTLILGLAIAIERVLFLAMSNNNNDKLLEDIKSALASGGKTAALEVCRSTKGPVASILYQGLDKMDDGIEMVDKAIVSLGSVENGKLERGVSWISLFIALAPMLGFMGTVIGMIQAFDSIEAAGDISPSLVAGGIKVALLTTVFGLIAAMILQIFYNLIVAMIDNLVNKMEDASITFLDIVAAHIKK
ncbi:MAG: MotA/TolQ/ExbB proton channel family protein [Schleiferiaceae bacterium]|jgi:biopolymer transport protein ExbB|nr:MotA/TolQ/ExbB proton channel family protein [Schleiferiaceae bacterium]MDP4629335.1 MotA/TolQ/ExbB proton channel family protein [Schleiferiaceae bacterium]MDP4742210.1 MotA/TolQ/ExbB proton channel family protein [Schleiferiaceae bacterium]MDP4774388.1 MotA/TolQ/ExbB proton channel family protein [Schleiferiaceae bacterium]MDP4855010.1 MotA/TolQ/ExbB proton channel family protein [Schleiferiaceae bacterium]